MSPAEQQSRRATWKSLTKGERFALLLTGGARVCEETGTPIVEAWALTEIIRARRGTP
jgi:hypothetical protein